MSRTWICSHGHFDHTAGIDGVIRAVGRDPLEIPTICLQPDPLVLDD